MPPHEWPTKTTLPGCSAIARFVAATSAAREVSGFCTATTFRPWACNNGTTLFHSDPSTNAPCTSTTVVSGVAADARVGIVKPASIVNASSKFLKPGTVIRIIYSFQGFRGSEVLCRCVVVLVEQRVERVEGQSSCSARVRTTSCDLLSCGARNSLH